MSHCLQRARQRSSLTPIQRSSSPPSRSTPTPAGGPKNVSHSSSLVVCPASAAPPPLPLPILHRRQLVRSTRLRPHCLLHHRPHLPHSQLHLHLSCLQPLPSLSRQCQPLSYCHHYHSRSRSVGTASHSLARSYSRPTSDRHLRIRRLRRHRCRATLHTVDGPTV